MLNPRLAKTSLFLAFAAQLAACSSSDERPLVVLDIRLGPDVVAPDVIRLSAASGGKEVRSAEVPWRPAANGILEVGLYVPENVTGLITISGKALKGAQTVAEGSVASEILLQKSGQVGPYPLVLSLSVTPPPGQLDGGLDGGLDGAIDSGNLDALRGPEATATPDTPPAEAGAPDTVTSEADAGDAPRPKDVAAPDAAIPDDVSLPTDATDAIQLDLSPAQPDTLVDVADAPEDRAEAMPPPIDTRPHVPAWEPAQSLGTSTGSSMFPAIAVDPVSENVYLAWADGISVKARRWTRATGTWEKTVQIEDRGAPNVVQIGADAKGNVIMVWRQDANRVSDAALLGVWTSRSSDGVSWSPPVRIGALNSSELYLSVARNGTARAIYTKTIPNQWYLYTAYFDGTSWMESAKELAVIDYSHSSTRFRGKLVVSATGDGVLLFNNDLGDGAVRTVVPLTGSTVGAATVMSLKSSANWSNGDAIAMNRKGEAVFVWAEADAAQTSIYARLYNPASGWGSIPPRIAAAELIAGDVAATLDEQDNITAVWQQYVPFHGMNLMGIHGSLSGSWSEVTPIETDNHSTTDPVNSAVPAMAIDGLGNSLLVWLKDESTTKALDYSAPRYGAYGSGYVNGAWLPQVALGQKPALTADDITLSVSDKGLGAAVLDYYYWPEPVTVDPDAFSPMVSFFR
jgi:hypothetical protein